MTTDPTVHRRRLLGIAGGIAVAGLAGCVGSPQADGGDAAAVATPSPAPTGEGLNEGDDHEDDEHTEDDHAEEEHDEEGTPEGHTPGDDVHGHEDEGHLHDEPVPDPVDHATVRMITTDDGFHFEPHVTRVHEGGTVTFVNESGAHSATAYHPDNGVPRRVPEGTEAWDSGLLSEASAEYEYTFDDAGVYQYYCIPHEQMGMIGALIVGDPDPHDQPGLAAPGDRFEGRSAEKIEELNEMCNEALGHGH